MNSKERKKSNDVANKGKHNQLKQRERLLKQRVLAKTSLERFNSNNLTPSQIPETEIVNIRIRLLNNNQIEEKRYY